MFQVEAQVTEEQELVEAVRFEALFEEALGVLDVPQMFDLELGILGDYVGEDF